MKVLDAGCGAGRHLCEAFRREGVHVVGIDLNRGDLEKSRACLALMAAEAERRYGEWMVLEADVTRLPFTEGAFDLVICSEVLEHIPDNAQAISELLRVLKPGKDLVVSVPRFFPERVCWALSQPYHQEPGGHIRIYKKKELKKLLEGAGAACRAIRYKHALHAPYWWLRCLVGHKNETSLPVRLYKSFLEWDIIRRPFWTGFLDRLLNPLISKSIVYYLKKGPLP